MQSITGAEVEGSHADPPLTVISLVSVLNGVRPGVSQGAGACLSVSNFHQEVIISVTRLELWHGSVVSGQRDQARSGPRTVPAAKFTGPGRLVVHGRADKHNALYLLESVSD